MTTKTTLVLSKNLKLPEKIARTSRRRSARIMQQAMLCKVQQSTVSSLQVNAARARSGCNLRTESSRSNAKHTELSANCAVCARLFDYEHTALPAQGLKEFALKIQNSTRRCQRRKTTVRKSSELMSESQGSQSCINDMLSMLMELTGDVHLKRMYAHVSEAIKTRHRKRARTSKRKTRKYHNTRTKTLTKAKAENVDTSVSCSELLQVRRLHASAKKRASHLLVNHSVHENVMRGSTGSKSRKHRKRKLIRTRIRTRRRRLCGDSDGELSIGNSQGRHVDLKISSWIEYGEAKQETRKIRERCQAPFNTQRTAERVFGFQA